MIKKILLALLVILVIIQFIHPKRNKSTGVQPYAIATAHTVPADVNTILEKACNDCHSNTTRYPWYCNFQPFDWWIAGHIKHGKADLNFDEFTNRSLRFQYNRLGGVVKLVKEDEMPLSSYLWIHKDAKLTADEKTVLMNWATAIRDSMKAIYPADSLERKQQ